MAENNNNEPDDTLESQIEGQDVNIDNLSDQLDADLNRFIDDTVGAPRDGRQGQDTRESRTPAQDQAPQGRVPQGATPQQQGRGQASQDNQAGERGQADGRTPQGGAVQQTPRRYGDKFVSDSNGAILDAAGRRIAAPGQERRIFDRLYNTFRGVETEHAVFKQRLDAYENADAAAKQAGLSLEERTASLRLMSAWKKDQKGTIQFLLNEAAKAGTDVSDIRQGGFDPAAMRSTFQEMVSEALKPFQFIIEDRQQQAEQIELRERASQELNEFHAEFPAASQHGNVIAAIMEAKGYNVREAWFALAAEAATRGWDLNRPLVQQAQASNGVNRPTGGQGNPRPLPPMQGRAGSAANGVVPNTRGTAKAEDSWDDIVRDSVRDATGIDLLA